jgi:threonine dehydrogenase-like Zn-dependent dehydrogenase
MVNESGSIRVADMPDSSPAARHVLITVGACGICGTHMYIADGEFPPTPGSIVPGHEFSGAVAPGVRRAEPLRMHVPEPAEFPAALVLSRSGTALKVQLLPR